MILLLKEMEERRQDDTKINFQHNKFPSKIKKQ